MPDIIRDISHLYGAENLTPQQRRWVETSPQNELMRIYLWTTHDAAAHLDAVAYQIVETQLLTDAKKRIPPTNQPISELRKIYHKRRPRKTREHVDNAMLNALLTLTST